MTTPPRDDWREWLPEAFETGGYSLLPRQWFKLGLFVAAVVVMAAVRAWIWGSP